MNNQFDIESGVIRKEMLDIMSQQFSEVFGFNMRYELGEEGQISEFKIICRDQPYDVDGLNASIDSYLMVASIATEMAMRLLDFGTRELEPKDKLKLMKQMQEVMERNVSHAKHSVMGEARDRHATENKSKIQLVT